MKTKSNKVGIITMYYDSYNYGGILQAYALQKYIEKMGYDCKQITYKKIKNKNILNKLKEKGIVNFIKWMLIKIKTEFQNKIYKFFISKNEKKYINLKFKKFTLFRNAIPHTEICTKNNIKNITNDMNYLICGSDQIWKPGIIDDCYLLKFANSNQKKISYAASIGKNVISKNDLEYLISNIQSFNYISLREKYDLNLLKNNLNFDIEWVVDPTLLLDKSEWENISSPSSINDDYVLCYFLTLNNKVVSELNNFSKRNKCQLVSLPYSDGKFNFYENKLNSIKIYDAGPNDFISLIKHAKYVLTDSFHATVFSHIFEIPFYTIERENAKFMNERIVSLLEIFEDSERFIKINDLKILNLNTNFKINYSNFNALKEKSSKFINKSLDRN